MLPDERSARGVLNFPKNVVRPIAGKYAAFATPICALAACDLGGCSEHVRPALQQRRRQTRGNVERDRFFQELHLRLDWPRVLSQNTLIWFSFNAISRSSSCALDAADARSAVARDVWRSLPRPPWCRKVKMFRWWCTIALFLSDFQLVTQPEKFEIGLRHVAREAEHDSAPGFFAPRSWARRPHWCAGCAPKDLPPTTRGRCREGTLERRTIGCRAVHKLVMAVADDRRHSRWPGSIAIGPAPQLCAPARRALQPRRDRSCWRAMS